MNKLREHLYLAALLHDIGRFYQRAKAKSPHDISSLNERIQPLADSILPQVNGQNARYDNLWTAQFIADYADLFQSLEADIIPHLEKSDELKTLASGIHQADDKLTDLGKILKKADTLSAGLDWNQTEELQAELQAEEKQWGHQTLRSILQYIKDGKPREAYELPVQAMHLEQSAFAQVQQESTDYNGLWKQFENEFKFIQTGELRAFTETLLSLLFKYTTSIPVNLTTHRDVALYDHLKMSAALAVCLYDFAESHEEAQAPFLLIGADFSGIQSYIYQIVSKYAGKNLKGRSFYLRLLSDTIVRYLLRELHLFQAHVVYNSGGSFYLLAPNTAQTRETLQKAIVHLEKQLFHTHGTALYVALDAVEVEEADLMHLSAEHNLAVVWKKLFEKRDGKKNGKFGQLLQNDYQAFFEPHHKGGAFMRDSITGEELTLEAVFNNNLRLNPETDQQIELGKKLKNVDYMVVSEAELQAGKGAVHLEPIHLGLHYYFVKTDELKNMQDSLLQAGAKATVITLNGRDHRCDFLPGQGFGPNIYSLEFYGGNDSGHITFEEMCERENEEAFHRLGVLRMDVDNLGSIFQSGIAPDKATMSRYAALSRSFDFFFSGYLNTLQDEVSPERSCIIYSGGDDVFMVGSWDDTIRLAHRIHQDFAAYTCNNPAFSISGGIAIVADKFPIMKGAEYSADEESRAKHHQTAQGDKNSISFMKMALNWDHEFPQVEALKNELVALLQAGKMNKSFLSKIQKHTANADFHQHQVKLVKTYWMLTYDLSRAKTETKDENVKALMNRCMTEVCHNHQSLNGQAIETEYHSLELWNFAARWAELECRTNK